MRALLLVFFSGLISFSNGQTIRKGIIERKGFVFGAATGISNVHLKFPLQRSQTEISFSLPNLKIGAMVSDRTMILVYLPGSIYSYKGSGRKRDRGFEAIVPSIQYWLNDRWWVLGGAGLGLDAPAFYDIQKEDERKFYFGGSAVFGTGYEILQNRKFAIDIQSRVHYNKIKVTEGNMTGLALNFLLGFTRY